MIKINLKLFLKSINKSTKLALRKVHLWMCLHKLFHFILFLKLVWCWETLLLLSHIKHHLLNCGSCISIEIWKFWWFRVNFLCINFSISFNWSTPPWCLVFPLLNIYMNVFAFISINFTIFNRPIGFLRINFIFPFSID